MIKKVSIIGAGYVGSSMAYSLMLKELVEEIVLIDVNEKAAQAEVADIRPGMREVSLSKVRLGHFFDTEDSDIIIIAAGIGRRPGESRMDLIGQNSIIASSISSKLKAYNARGIVIVVTNPVDVITWIVAQELNEMDGRVFGTGCLLDSARFRLILADFLQIEEKNVRAFVAGEHGPHQILLWSSVTIEGRPLSEWLRLNNMKLTQDDKDLIAQRVSGMGASIIEGKGHTHYGVSSCVVYIASVIARKDEAIMSLSCPLNVKNENRSISISLPCVLNKSGIVRTEIEILSKGERFAMKELVANFDDIKVNF